MFKKKTFLKLMVAVAAVFSVSDAMALEDYSKSYQYGGMLRTPGPNDFQGSQRPILEVNSGFDAGGILGCSGLDLGAQLENTFNVGNLGDEFKNYLQNTIATEALSLLYSQPGVSQVLDGMKAIGHARVSINQERCNANEILANVTNKRLKDEAYAECIQENAAEECAGSTLQGYIEQISQSRRWSGTLHDHMCDEENSTLCNFMPNFAYDIGTGEGQTSQPTIPPSTIRNQGEYFAEQCLEQRARTACALMAERGYSQAMRDVASGAVKITCGDSADATPPAADTDTPPAAGDTTDPNAGLAGNEDCSLEVDGADVDASNIYALLQAGNVNPTQMIEGHTRCLIAQEIHGHVDINMCRLPVDRRAGVRKGIAQGVATRAGVNVYGALIQALTEAVLRSGGRESSDADNSMNPQMLEFASAQLDAMRAARDALIADQALSESVAARIAAMNDSIDEAQERIDRQISGAMARGAGVAPVGSADNPRSYGDLFRQ